MTVAGEVEEWKLGKLLKPEERRKQIDLVPMVWINIQFGPTKYNGSEGLQAEKAHCQTPP